MSLKKVRIFALAGVLAAVGVMSVTASASAAVTPQTEELCAKEEGIPFPPGPEGPFPSFLGAGLAKTVNGFMTVRKLNQSIPLQGGRFAGLIGLCAEAEEKINGSINKSTIKFPAFTAPLKIFGQPTEVTGEIRQSAKGEGTITKPAGEACTPTTCTPEGEFDDITLNVQAEANLIMTNIKLFGLSLPLQCTTKEPIHLPFVKAMTIFELLVSTTVTGTATMPPVKCSGILGLPESIALTALFSGPNNPFTLTFGETSPVTEEELVALEHELGLV